MDELAHSSSKRLRMPSSTPGNGIEGFEGLPEWALQQATGELGVGVDEAIVAAQAWRLVRDAESRKTERHDEFDDPDEGGEG